MKLLYLLILRIFNGRECIFVSNDKEQNNEEIFEDNHIGEGIKEKSNDEHPIEKETHKKITCSNCGTENPKSNLFCKNCGSPFVQKVFCQSCNSEMPVYNSFCSKCGGILKQNIPRIQQTPGTMHITPHPSQQQIVDSQRYYVAPPPQDQIKTIEQIRLAKNQTYNMIATVVGFLMIFAGIVGLIFFIIMMAVAPSVIDEIVPIDQRGYYYGTLAAMFIPTITALVIAGISLVTYRPEGNAWKGFYYTLRYLFVGFSSILAIFIVLSIGSWIFYNPSTPLSGSPPFWLFTMIEIPIVNFPLVALVVIVLMVFFLGIVSMEIPILIRIIKKHRKNKKTSEEISLDDSSSKESIHLEFDTERKIFEESGVKLSVLDKRKGILPSIFYLFKNNPLVGSIELLGASYVTSIIIILILTPFIREDTELEPIEEQNPFTTILSLAWAGVFEEISFRLLIIGIPMIFVVLVRYLMQQKNDSETNKLIPADRVKVLDDAEKIRRWDIPLAIRGKYKKISYPEWTLIIISSTLFGFAHWEKWTGSWGAWKIVQAGVAGIFLSYAFVKYGIESAIFIHVSNNVLIGLAVFSGTVGANWIAGISGFVISCLWAVGVLKFFSLVIGFALTLYYRKDDKKSLNY